MCTYIFSEQLENTTKKLTREFHESAFLATEEKTPNKLL